MNVPAVRTLAGSIWACLLIVLTSWACTVSDDRSTNLPANDATTHNSHADEKKVDLSIEVRDGEVVGGIAELDVVLGDRVTVAVRSDEADEIHVHGYDVSQELKADRSEEISFAADIPGEFEVELEARHLTLLVLRVR